MPVQFFKNCSRVISQRVLIVLPLVGFVPAGALAANGEMSPFFNQLLAEVESAPAPVLVDLRSDDAKLREFIAGRLHDERVAQYAREHGLDQRADVRAVVGAFTRDTLAKTVFADFQKAEIAKLPNLEALARQYYQVNSAQYEKPEAIRVAHILVKVDVEEISDDEIAERRAHAEMILERVRKGEDFGDLAREFSEDKASAKNGGQLPTPAPRDSLVPPFERAAWALKPGETSGLVRTRFGYHIIRLLNVVPVSVQPFEEVKASIIQRIENELLAPKRAAFIDSFRDQRLEAEADALLPEIRAVLNRNAAKPGGQPADQSAQP